MAHTIPVVDAVIGSCQHNDRAVGRELLLAEATGTMAANSRAPVIMQWDGPLRR
jgi:hypothetical protein